MVANTLAVVDEFDEPVIVIFRHRDVDVVVPGDEALMAGSAEQGAVYEPIAKAVFFWRNRQRRKASRIRCASNLRAPIRRPVPEPP